MPKSESSMPEDYRKQVFYSLNHTQNMKRSILALLLFSAAFALMACGENDSTNIVNNIEENNPKPINNKMYIKVNGHTLTATLADNSSTAALIELLKKGDLTYEANDYGNFEKVGNIGTSLPQNNTNITTTPGDIILYQGNNICIYYDTNTWNFTRLGKIDNISQTELKDILGTGKCSITLSLK